MAAETAVAFLDLDGVLNSFSSYDWSEGPEALLLPRCVANFNKIIEATAASIVLSSSWRHYILGGHMTVRGFEHLLRSHGVRGSMIGHTCHDSDADTRGQQIRLWRRQNVHRGPYVVLDDLDDGISDCGLNFVRVNGTIGLSADDADRAIQYLTGASP